MITFKQFIQEDKFQFSAEDAASLIKSGCQEYLKLGVRLFRGVTGGEGDAFEGTVRANRIPKDTSKSAHNILDAYFKKTFGLAARSEALFVSPDLTTAAGYGMVYEIFPLDGFDYVWSPILEDAYYLESKTPDPFDARDSSAKQIGIYIIDAIKKLWPITRTFTDNKIIDLIYFGEFEHGKEEKLKLPNLSVNNGASQDARDAILTKLLELHGADIYKANTGINKNVSNEIMMVCDRYVAVRAYVANSKEFKDLLK